MIEYTPIEKAKRQPIAPDKVIKAFDIIAKLKNRGRGDREEYNVDDFLEEYSKKSPAERDLIDNSTPREILAKFLSQSELEAFDKGEKTRLGMDVPTAMKQYAVPQSVSEAMALIRTGKVNEKDITYPTAGAREALRSIGYDVNALEGKSPGQIKKELEDMFASKQQEKIKTAKEYAKESAATRQLMGVNQPIRREDEDLTYKANKAQTEAYKEVNLARAKATEELAKATAGKKEKEKAEKNATKKEIATKKQISKNLITNEIIRRILTEGLRDKVSSYNKKVKNNKSISEREKQNIYEEIDSNISDKAGTTFTPGSYDASGYLLAANKLKQNIASGKEIVLDSYYLPTDEKQLTGMILEGEDDGEGTPETDTSQETIPPPGEEGMKTFEEDYPGEIINSPEALALIRENISGKLQEIAKEMLKRNYSDESIRANLKAIAKKAGIKEDRYNVDFILNEAKR